MAENEDLDAAEKILNSISEMNNGMLSHIEQFIKYCDLLNKLDTERCMTLFKDQENGDDMLQLAIAMLAGKASAEFEVYRILYNKMSKLITDFNNNQQDD